jgi:hypothetical protein
VPQPKTPEKSTFYIFVLTQKYSFALLRQRNFVLDFARTRRYRASNTFLHLHKKVSMDIKVEVEGIKKTGVSKAQKPYFILSCYVYLPDVRHPQACELFSDKALNNGIYNVPADFSIVDKRPAMSLNVSEAVPVKVGQAA